MVHCFSAAWLSSGNGIVGFLFFPRKISLTLPAAMFQFTFVRTGPCAYEQIQEQYTVALPDISSDQAAEWEYLHTELVGKLLQCLIHGGCQLKPSDIRLTTLAGEELPAGFLQNGATACQFG